MPMKDQIIVFRLLPQECQHWRIQGGGAIWPCPPKASEGGPTCLSPPKKRHECDHEWESDQDISSSSDCFVVLKGKISRLQRSNTTIPAPCELILVLVWNIAL